LRIICKEGIKDKKAVRPPNLQQTSSVYCEHLAVIAFKEKNYDEIFYYGNCVKQDPQKAVDLNNKSMDNGVARAYTHSGWMPANGEVYAKNIVAAYVYW
jgi:TPR repeat protein